MSDAEKGVMLSFRVTTDTRYAIDELAESYTLLTGNPAPSRTDIVRYILAAGIEVTREEGAKAKRAAAARERRAQERGDGDE